MRPTVDKVESSIKGGVKAKLGRKTLVLGANGLGKSAIVNAVELAGTGKASDVAGRSVLAKDADLFMLAPPGADHVSARAHLSEGAGMAAWELKKGHRAKRTGPEIAFPLRGVEEALLGSAETARKWVLQHGTPFSWSDVIMLVPASLQPRLEIAFPLRGVEEALLGSAETARKWVLQHGTPFSWSDVIMLVPASLQPRLAS